VRKAKFVTSAILIFLVPLLSLAQPQPERTPFQDSRQLIVVTTSDWTATTGKLERYERRSDGWVRVGEAVEIVVGRSGFGWGIGAVPTEVGNGQPVKKEGDGRSPAGVFPVGAAFGFAEQKPDWLKLPYIPLTSATECVDDASSEYYNAVVDRIQTQRPDWKTSEKMRDIAVYEWGVIVNQNSARQRGAGSCIFLHIWNGPQRPTAGCTAMDQRQLVEIMRWLDPAANPMMVALTSSEYERLRSSWQLP